MSDSSAPVINLNPARVLVFLLVCTALLLVLGLSGQYIRVYPQSIDVHGHWQEFWIDILEHTFDMNAEADIPTFFKVIVMFGASLLFAVVSVWKFMERDRFRFHWAGLSLLTFYLSMDDASVIHEKLIKPMRAEFNQPGGVLYFAWVIPAVIVLALLALLYLRFFLDLELKFKLLFLFSLPLYFLGEVGGEMLSGVFAERFGQKSFPFAVTSAIEETTAMIGLSIMIFMLLKYIERYLPDGITLKI